MKRTVTEDFNNYCIYVIKLCYSIAGNGLNISTGYFSVTTCSSMLRNKVIFLKSEILLVIGPLH